jgi:hypothetical protein
MRREHREDMQDELIRQMVEPDDLRALRNQKERIEEEQRRESQRARDDAEKDRLRKEIRALGHKPIV